MTQQELNPFATDQRDELPVGLQLNWRLRALILSGQLAAGERLPSFRRLSEWAGVHLGTVRAVYARLEEDGLVVTRQGRGTFVADDVRAAPELEEIVSGALARAAESGFNARDLAIVAMACADLSNEAAGAEGMPDLEAESELIEVRRELRRQIAQLEAELARHTRHLAADLPTAPRRAVAHVAGVEELEETRDTLIAQLAEAQRETERQVRREARARGPLGRAMSRWRSRY